MMKVLLALIIVSNLSAHAFAATSDGALVSSTVSEVTNEGANVESVAAPLNASGLGSSIGSTLSSDLSHVSLDQLITLGEKVWTYVLDNKPNAQFQTIKTSIVPSGITDWTQLSGWTAPVSKIYHVQFKDAIGISSGSFDYQIMFVPGGSYQGHGKFLGEIQFLPTNIKLSTGRSLNVTAELSAPLNFGTEADPVAAAQLTVSWTSPTLTHYQMQSAEYFIYGSGDIQDLSAGTP